MKTENLVLLLLYNNRTIWARRACDYSIERFFYIKKRTLIFNGAARKCYLIESTHSNWVNPSLSVRKKNGSLKLVLDYRGLNSYIEQICCQLPSTKYVNDSLDGNPFL